MNTRRGLPCRFYIRRPLDSFFLFSSRRRHTRCLSDWSSDVCSSDLGSFRLAPLISAIGMSIFLQNYVQVFQGARVKPMPPLVEGGFTVFESGGFAVRLSYLQLF